jgi:hypothetical protein
MLAINYSLSVNTIPLFFGRRRPDSKHASAFAWPFTRGSKTPTSGTQSCIGRVNNELGPPPYYTLDTFEQFYTTQEDIIFSQTSINMAPNSKRKAESSPSPSPVGRHVIKMRVLLTTSRSEYTRTREDRPHIVSYTRIVHLLCKMCLTKYRSSTGYRVL